MERYIQGYNNSNLHKGGFQFSNMHSGYNGLQSGLSVIIISTLVIKSYFSGKLDAIIPVGAFWVLWLLGVIIFSAKAFEGNIGSLLSGSLIGV